MINQKADKAKYLGPNEKKGAYEKKEH